MMKSFCNSIRSKFIIVTKNSLCLSSKNARCLMIWQVIEILFSALDLISVLTSLKDLKPDTWQWLVVDLVYTIIGQSLIRINMYYPHLKNAIGIAAYIMFILNNIETYIWLKSDSLIIINVFMVWLYSIVLFNDFISTILRAFVMHAVFYAYALTVFAYRVPNDLNGNISTIILIKVSLYGFIFMLMPLYYIMEQRLMQRVAMHKNEQSIKGWIKVMQSLEIGIRIQHLSNTLFKNQYFLSIESVLNDKLNFNQNDTYPINVEHGELKYRIVKGKVQFRDRECDIYYMYNITSISKEEEEKCLQLLIATITHELRTPLNIIMAIFHQLLECPGIKDKDIIRKGLISAELQEALINDILDVSKINYGKLVINNIPTNIHQTMKEIYELFKFKIIESIKFIFDDTRISNHHVLVDAKRLKQIIYNLLSNSIKFTKSGYIKIDAKLQKTKFTCSIIDTGIGISESDHCKIFTQFGKGTSHSILNPSGTGLGLNLCKKLCEAMGGEIKFTSIPGEKTIFTFTIPVEHSNLNSSEGNPMGNDKMQDMVCVLNIDDDPLNIFILNNYAAKSNVKCINFTHSVDSVKALERESFEVSIAFIDLNMPEMDGYQTAKRIKEIRPNILLVAVTGSDKSTVERQCISCGFSDVLEKPLTYEKYDLYVKKLLLK